MFYLYWKATLRALLAVTGNNYEEKRVILDLEK